jgi:Zn-dependent M28 family amino/carboxypeptidase
MLASPNYIYGIFDGAGSSFNMTGPQGSGDIQKLFQQFFVQNGLNHTALKFTGRSDYAPFVNAGIASGGISTGAGENKTKKDVELFGGLQDVAHDKNYHRPGDNVTNLNMAAFLVNTRAIAHAVGVFGQSLRGIAFNETRWEGIDAEEDEKDDEDENEDDDEVTRRIRKYPQIRSRKVSRRPLHLQRSTRKAPLRSKNLWA